MRDLERSAAFWLRAYPTSWRAERATEVTAVLVDLVDDDARRLDARTALGLLRGGLATRWRQTPPLWVYLPYRMFDLRLPERYRGWVVRDISSPGHLRRSLLGRAWLFLLPVYAALNDLRPGTLVMWAAMIVATAATLLCVRPDASVRRRLQHHARPGWGEPRTVGAFVWVQTSRARIAAQAGSSVLVLLLAVGAVVWSAAALVAPARLVLDSLPCDLPASGPCFEVGSTVAARDFAPGVAALLAVATVVGVLLAAMVVARRLDRRLPIRPAQPARHLLGLRPQARVGVALWVVLVVAAALAEATGAWVFAVSAVAGPLCLLLLPSAVVVRSRARATPDAAFVDLWRVAWTGRPVAVDRPDSELVPAFGLEAR
ncbi:hypothetical protein HP550_03830 [Cellulomonas humilata]|uniref:Uncharacterized protein n=1 Tax=Cellulomonas humilata TaxID=144055 RepID=A0A7Y5ZYB4_9CELL|nr:hypothetical protein [Cellulomonas humilata]NUU16376.1 hypothetical protein [Cellulomonas humilata]